LPSTWGINVTERRDLMVATKSELCCTGASETGCVCTGNPCIAGAFAAASGCLQPENEIEAVASNVLTNTRRFNDQTSLLLLNGDSSPAASLGKHRKGPPQTGANPEPTCNSAKKKSSKPQCLGMDEAGHPVGAINLGHQTLTIKP
jgi:hypothetical protein